MQMIFDILQTHAACFRYQTRSEENTDGTDHSIYGKDTGQSDFID